MYCVSKSQAPARRFAPFLAAALALTLTIAAARPVDAADPRAASMVIDANTGAVLHNKGGDELVYPASLTKMMTLYMTFELIELGRLNYDSKIKMTQEGADAAPDYTYLAAELLHYADPERYPLMTRWVWDARANTGVLREIWHDENVDSISIDVADGYATFLVLREELAQYLATNGVFREIPRTDLLVEPLRFLVLPLLLARQIRYRPRRRQEQLRQC